MKKLLFLPLLAAVLLAACGDSNEDVATPEVIETQEANLPDDIGLEGGVEGWSGEYLNTGNLVRNYFEPSSLWVSFHSPSQGSFSLDLTVVMEDLDNWDYAEGWQEYLPWSEVKKYSEFYGDTTYKAMNALDQRYRVSVYPLNSISITSDRDFDAEHPAGSLLNDLFVLEYSSAYDVIKSGYDPLLDMANIDYWNQDIDAFQQMPLSEYEPKKLLHSWTDFYFTKLPETLGEYTFYVSFDYGIDPVTGKEGKTASGEVKAVFTESDYVAMREHPKPCVDIEDQLKSE